ncbi:hypothetical protein ACFZAM_31415 [Streptomyces sp. NPDC008079]|uniref:5'-3' exonuclease n=1 Tax=Streptomyces sp. NPDC008079 TaxID=3364806 RepID=UPI0036E96F57
MRPTLLVDGNNILIRAVEATRRTAMTSPVTGRTTAAMVVVAQTLSRYITAEQPFRVIILWDSGHAARSALFPAYKAQRPQGSDPYRSESKDLVRQFLDLCRIPQLAVPGEEADDLIAAYWRTAAGPVTILSSDKDLLQLVGTTPTGYACEQIRVSSADTPTDRWDAATVQEHFGCTPAQLPVAMSLAGDTSDNIPGVPGIGMVKAVKILSGAAWRLDGVTHAAVVAHRAEIDVYRQLVDLRDVRLDLPQIPPFMPTTVGPDRDWVRLHEFLSSHALQRLTNRLNSGRMWR